MVYQDFPPALMILSPRVTKAGDPGSSVVGLNTTPLADGSIVWCIENKLPYQLDKTSTAAPDGNLILAPLTGPGRWIAPAPPVASAAARPGYDALVEHVNLQAGGAWLEIPRNGAGDPIRVTLTGLTPGNTLEVFWSANAIANNPPADMFVYAVVAFGDLTPTFPGDYDVIGNSGGSQTITATSAQRGSCSAFAAVPIPPGMTTAVVELIYKIGFSSVDVWGINDMFATEPGTGISLKVTEEPASSVVQAGPGNTLTPIP